MNVIVTGASGLAGSHIVDDLIERGFDVIGLDVVPPRQRDRPWTRVDLTDYAEVEAALRGGDAVVHMGAIPRPGSHTSTDLFRTNVMGTFNVFEAAATLGIDRVVQGSSMSVLGYPFFYHRFAPTSVPIDETHALQPQDPYALSKLVGEDIAQAFVRRTGMAAISLRLAWIHTPETFRDQLVPLWEDPAAGASNLWSYVDGRDVAQACRLALTAPISGHLPCFIAAANTFMPRPTVELVSEFYPESTIDPDLPQTGSLLSSKLAFSTFGFEAEHSWESYDF
jgi:nucleoside-diphosphate-sugar epimerase